MNDLPAPLVPPECDLQDFPFMPLHVARLRDSDLAAEADPEACWYAVLLWAASWHQIPAASLPDNDAVLARLLGLGRDLKTFRKHKASAMRGFVACSDGRLYHAVVAEQAVESWRRKLEQRWRTECARIKKANQRTGAQTALPTFERFHASLPAGQRLVDVPVDSEDGPQGQNGTSLGTGGACPSGKGIQETGIETGTGTNMEEKANASSSAAPSADQAGRREEGEIGRDLLGEPVAGKRTRRKPETAIPEGYPDAAAVADGQQRFRDNGLNLDAHTQAERFRNHAQQTDRRCRDWAAAWRNWIIGEIERAPKVKTAARPGDATLQLTWPGPPDVWAAVSREKTPEWAASYLGQCAWRDVPRRALVCGKRFVVETIQREVGHVLDSLDVSIIEEKAA